MIFMLLLCTLPYSFAETLYAVCLSKKDLDILQAIDAEVDRLEAECNKMEERSNKSSPSMTVDENVLQPGGLNPFYQYERHTGIPQPRNKECEAGVLSNTKSQRAEMSDRDEEELPPPPPRIPTLMLGVGQSRQSKKRARRRMKKAQQFNDAAVQQRSNLFDAQPNHEVLGFPQIQQDEREPHATGPMRNPAGLIWRERDSDIKAEEDKLVHKAESDQPTINMGKEQSQNRRTLITSA